MPLIIDSPGRLAALESVFLLAIKRQVGQPQSLALLVIVVWNRLLNFAREINCLILRQGFYIWR